MSSIKTMKLSRVTHEMEKLTRELGTKSVGVLTAKQVPYQAEGLYDYYIVKDIIFDGEHVLILIEE